MQPDIAGSSTAQSALAAAAALLAATSDTSRLDAELLMAHALGESREDMLLGGLDRSIPPRFATLVERRMQGEPVAYITGERDFWTFSLSVSPAVLIPRPDSETLIEAAIEHFRGSSGPRRVLDLGTGSGALLLAALTEWPDATGVGIDRSAGALDVARSNAARLGLADRAEMIAGGWSGTGELFDLILCNPPYIGTDETVSRDVLDHEPHGALFAGRDGLDDYRDLTVRLPAQIAPAGVACLEIGASQGLAVSALFADRGLTVRIRHDLGDRPRCLVLTQI